MFRTLGVILAALVAAVTVAIATDTPAGGEDAGTTPLRASASRSPGNALRGHVHVVTDEPMHVTVRVRAADGRVLQVRPPEPVDGQARIPILQLTPSTVHDVTVTGVPASGGPVEVAAGTIVTGRLPDGLPPVTATGRSGDGLTLFETLYKEPAGQQPLDRIGAVVAVDPAGQVVWYQRLPLGTEDVTPSDRGTLLVTYHEMTVRELDPAGGTVDDWVGTSGRRARGPAGHRVARAGAVPVASDQFHHEVVELDDGTLVTLGREVRDVTYPEPMCDDSDSRTARVAADVVVQIDPDSGEILREFSLFDAIDPTSPDSLDRIVTDEFCSPYLEPRYPTGGVRDWTHANGIEVDEDRNVVWVSARHLDQVVALRWRDDADGPAGQVVWRLGRGGDFELSDGEWFFHQHAPELQPDGSLLIYDNGNFRPGTSLDDPDNPPYSRAVRYDLDTTTMTATQAWQHRFPDQDMVYAPYVGDADVLDDGRVLIAHGGLLDPPAESPNDPGSVRWGRIVEVDPDSGRVLFDLRTRDPEGRTGWGLYRAERLDDLYPPGWQVSVG